MSLKRKETTHCRVRDQFCTGKFAARCALCHDEMCMACSINVGGALTCHACLRMRGGDALVEQHLVLLGGTTRKAEAPAWRVVRR
jgi:hypothetical protein